VVPGGGSNLTHVFILRKLLILKSTQSLKSPEATSLGTNWAQSAELILGYMLMRSQSAADGGPPRSLDTVHRNNWRIGDPSQPEYWSLRRLPLLIRLFASKPSWMTTEHIYQFCAGRGSDAHVRMCLEGWHIARNLNNKWLMFICRYKLCGDPPARPGE
jgi:hypothetical protein